MTPSSRLLLLPLLTAGCSTGPTLTGTWDLTTTPTSGQPTQAVVVIGKNQLTVTTPQWSFTGTKTASTLNFTSNSGNGDTPGVAAATQTSASFNAGLIPFDLGGTWTIQGGNQGGSTSFECTATVSSSEIDGSCNNVDTSGAQTLFWTGTTSKSSSASSDFGDFGGTWLNSSTSFNNGTADAPEQCQLEFGGSSISSCLTGGSFLQGITFAYDGNSISGAVAGSAEFSATLQ